MFDRPQSDVNPVIQRRREQENERAKLHATLQANGRLGHIAQWEVTTHKTYQRNQVKALVSKAKKQAEQNLNERRARLTRLIAEDEARCAAELAALQETPEQKSERMTAYARDIKAAKEAKRKAFVEEQYYRQWREQCDDIRTIDSKKRLEAVLSERETQVAVKKAEAEVLKAEDRKWSQDMQDDWMRKGKRAEADAMRAELINSKTREDLEWQMKEITARREAEKQQRAREAEEARLKLLADIEAQRQAEIKKAEDQRRKNAEITEYNNIFQAKKRDEAARQAAEEMAILRSNLDAHREETQKQHDDKLRMRYETEAYREYIAQRRAKEAQMERELERLIQIELDRVNGLQDAKKQREELARKHLMQEVEQERINQRLAKERQRLRDIATKQAEKASIESDQRKFEAERHEQELQKRQLEIQRGLEMQAQVLAAREAKEARRRANEQFQADAGQAEAVYRAKLAAEAASKDIGRPRPVRTGPKF